MCATTSENRAGNVCEAVQAKVETVAANLLDVAFILFFFQKGYDKLN